MLTGPDMRVACCGWCVAGNGSGTGCGTRDQFSLLSLATGKNPQAATRNRHVPCFGTAQMLLEPKYLPKLAATVGLFTRYGLADFAKQQGLKGIAPDPESGDVDGAPSAEKAVAFRKRLVELGPAYVKLGQVLSTRPDLLPETYIHELEKLQDDVGQIPIEDVRATIEEELHARISKLFEEFDDDPIG